MDTPRRDGETGVTPGSHYFDSRPQVGSRPARVRLELPDLSMELQTDRGIFSPHRIDPGTRLLLTELPHRLAGPVLDVGCGYGAIACTVAARAPGTDVWAVDVNERARALCRANARTAGLHVRVVAPEEVPEDQRFGGLVSNPPVRVGKAALHRLLEHWLARLLPGGEAWLVVNRNLGADSLARWLGDAGHQVQRVRSRQGYRVMRVSAEAGGIDAEP